MKNAWIIVAVFSFALLSCEKPVEKSHEDLAAEFVSVMKFDEQIEEMFGQIKEMQTAQLDRMNLPEELEASRQALREKMSDYMEKKLSWEALKPDFIKIYMEIFSKEDFQGLVDFYNSPLGLKFLEKTPELFKKSMEMTQQYMANIMVEIPKIRAAWLEEQKEAEKAPVAPPTDPSTE